MKNIVCSLLVCLLFLGCAKKDTFKLEESERGKKVIYQVFTRLFGNKNTLNKPWGTQKENGVGKFDDFTDLALREIKQLGITHIWYTGVLHHAMIADYSAYGISNDDPDVVKGRAGSPYAVKDYYNVDPDLAVDPSNRLKEFENLIERTHNAGLKVIIDIVPNHVARSYEGLSNPDGIYDFGAHDDISKEYDKNNNFYYVVDSDFKVPVSKNNYRPLGGEKSTLNDGFFKENPAKWTGNGSRKAQPDFNDWYETVKINYGVRPDGSADFDLLPEEYKRKSVKEHYMYWRNKKVPNSWGKFRDIALYWLDKGVDGFRYDMAEMVPVEFWSYMNSSIKMKNSNAILLAEVYNSSKYRDYIYKGKMDYLYDKVALYDTIKSIVKGTGKTDHITKVLTDLEDIEHHMLHFLENHDEHRFSSLEFAGSADKAKPAILVSTTSTTAPTMLYFGQEVGEKALENPGFGKASRTSIFDYVGVPAHQRWMNNGLFDGGKLSAEEKDLRDFYKRLFGFTIQSSALMGDYYDLHALNRNSNLNYSDKLFSYARWSDTEKLIILANFSSKNHDIMNFVIPKELVDKMNLKDGKYALTEQLFGVENSTLFVENSTGSFRIKLNKLSSLILNITPIE